MIKKIDYIRSTPFKSYEIYFPRMGHSLPIYKSHQNIPEAFEDKYFTKKEMENLLKPKDILNYL